MRAGQTHPKAPLPLSLNSPYLAAMQTHLDPADRAGLQQYLQQQNYLAKGEPLAHVEKPGEGNMNLVLRVCTPMRSFILKQARPYVEKYPDIAAPTERSAVEAAYLEATAGNMGIAGKHPRLLHQDVDNHVLILQDLGNGQDYTRLYRQGSQWRKAQTAELLGYLSLLHRLTPTDFPTNDAMRALNHEHLFVFPLRNDTGFNLDSVQPGLQDLAQPLRQNEELRAKFDELGKLYRSKGTHLLHGDFYPGSWLATEQGLKVIDPEFAFCGPVEFDLGVFLAHLYLSRHEKHALDAIRSYYANDYNQDLLLQFAGVEIIRRLIGLAQLPVDLDLQEKAELLKTAELMVLR